MSDDYEIPTWEIALDGAISERSLGYCSSLSAAARP